MKKLKTFDYMMLGIIAVLVIVAVLVITGKNDFSKTPVESTQNIRFEVMLRGVTLTDSQAPFAQGNKTFITIRNVPYTELEIVDVKFAPKKYLIQIPNPQNPVMLIDDPTQPYLYDFVVTVKDFAKITADGAVVGGNKIKIGMPIILEGYNYKLGGVVSNIIIPGKTHKTPEQLQVPSPQTQTEEQPKASDTEPDLEKEIETQTKPKTENKQVSEPQNAKNNQL